MYTISVFCIFLISGLGYAVQVDGYCFLQNQSNHTGSRVLFDAVSPSAVTDSAFTDSAGYYGIDLSQGVYDIYFTHEGYYSEEMLNRLFMSNTTLQSVTLTQIIQNELSGALNGILAVNTYRIVGDIFVQSEDSLFIQPGTIFLFDGPHAFDVNGYLSAIGTEVDSIRFMLTLTAAAWAGIDFNQTANDSSTLRFCHVTGSDSAGIYCNGSSPIIDHCSISGNSVSSTGGYGGGLCIFQNSNATISNCTITDNSVSDASYGGGIYCGYNCSPMIENCMIQGNEIGVGGCGAGVCCDEYSTPTIRNCTIAYNSTYWVNGYGGGIYCDWSIPTIENCVVSHNSTGFSGWGGGIYLIGTDATISHCTIYGNSAQQNPDNGVGGGIVCNNSSPVIENCTITGNSAGAAGSGGGIYVFGSLGAPTISNTIVQGNVGQGGICFDGAGVNAFVTYSDFHGNGGYNFYGNVPEHLGTLVTENTNGDSCDIFYNILLDPIFSTGYHLQSGSPCIDAGDPNSPLDPDSTIADIGAFYYDQLWVKEPPDIVQPSTFQLLPCFPNPFNSSTRISYVIQRPIDIGLTIYDLLGRRVTTLVDGRQDIGEYSVIWSGQTSSGTPVSSGIYFVQMQSQNLMQIQKMVLLR